MLTEIGICLTVPVTLSAALANARPADQAIVTGLLYLFRHLGFPAGLSIATALVQEALGVQLGRRFDAATAERLLEAVKKSLDAITRLQPADAAKVRASYDEALRVGWWYCLAAFAVAFGIAGACLFASETGRPADQFEQCSSKPSLWLTSEKKRTNDAKRPVAHLPLSWA